MRLVMVQFIAFALSVLTISCQNYGAIPNGFIVAIVGNGVPNDASELNAIPRSFPLDESKGRAIWRGASLALEHHSTLAPYRNGNLLTIKAFDDYGDNDRAQQIAKKIAFDPSIIAVIGHTASGTTQSAAHIYDKAAIPLLMPIATSPIVMFPPNYEGVEKRRLRRAFRLPPADDRVQAPAAAWVIQQEIRSNKVFAISDNSRGAKIYSGPLCDEIVRLLSNILSINRPMLVDGERDDLGIAAGKVKGSKADTVIFCGYSSTAQQLLESLREEYRDDELERRPKIILTDGAQDETVDLSDFDLYLTFPLPPLEKIGEIPAVKQIKSAMNKEELESYEIYAYDAMLIMASALKKCEATGISRHCIGKILLESNELFRGAAFAYTFLGGENIESSYHVYKSSGAQPGLIHLRELTRDDLLVIDSSTGN